MKNVGQIVDVDAPCRHIRCDEHLQLPHLETAHDAVSLGLGKVPVKRVSSVSFFHQCFRQVLRVALGATENDAEQFRIHVHEPRQSFRFVCMTHRSILVVDVVIDRCLRVDAHLHGVLHVLLDHAANFLRHGG